MNPQNASQGGDSPNPPAPHNPQSAAANLIRSQIDTLYGDQPVATPLDEGDNPYNRTHNTHPQPEADQWKAYHTAWQNYYQKYYEAFYAHKTAQQAGAQQPGQAQSTNASVKHLFAEQTDFEQTTEELTRDQALFELRQKLLGTVKTRATKIRRSRHFIPIVASLAVVLVFLFLQYNRVIIATVNAYVSPGAIDPQNIVIDPNGEAEVSADPRLIIPKINVDVPVLYDVGYDHASQMAAMEKGVAHFAIPGANSHPGEIGNTVLSGHSSNDLFDTGDYKFIFAQLDKLSIGDTIYANYQGKRYTYVITKKEVVKPNEVNKLIYPTDKPIMTLITCTPLGTALNRLLVTAEQINPDPSAAAAAPEGSGEVNADASMPGDSPSFLERLFGAR